VQKLYGKEARALRSLNAAQKPEILGLLFVFSIFIDLFVIFASFPIYIISGLVGNLSATLRAARSVPALIAILIVVFITDDAWRVFGLESTLRLSIMIVMLVAVSVLVLVTGLRKWMAQDSWLGVVGYSVDGGEKILAKWAESAPALAFFVPRVRPVLPIDDGDGGDSNDLRKSLESNVTILLFIAIIASAIAIAFWISLAFIAVGIVAVTKPMTEELTGGRISVIWQLDLLGQSFIFTRQLLFLSIMLGGIAALTFSAAAVQDASSRSALREYALTDVRHAVSGYAYYMGAIYNVANQLVTDGVWDELQKVDKMALKKRLGSIFEPM